MRVLINEIDGVEQRYRISQEKDFAVMDDQLTPILVQTRVEGNLVHFTPLKEDIKGTFFQMQLKPFRIFNYVDDKLVMTLNEDDTLYFEKSTGIHNETCLVGDLDKEIEQTNTQAMAPFFNYL